jgi:galactose mutarotase-like enzyme
VELEREKYQKEIDGKKVDLYTIKNEGGMVVKITNWGAKVQQILVPAKCEKHLHDKQAKGARGNRRVRLRGEPTLRGHPARPWS